MVTMMPDWDSDLLLQVIQFLNVHDADRLALQSRRFFYLVQHYRRMRGPQLVAESSAFSVGVDGRTPNRTAKETCHKAVEKLQSPPNLCLAFGTRGSILPNCLVNYVHKDTVILGSTSPSIEVGVNRRNTNSALMLLAGLSEQTTVQSFCLDGDDEDDDLNDAEFFSDEDSKTWKMFIIYACGGGAEVVEMQVKALQSRFPNATIVGGICSSAYVSVPLDTNALRTEEDYYNRYTSAALLELNRDMGGPPPRDGLPKRELARHVHTVALTTKYVTRRIQNGICGVALAGDVPVKSVVSRGVRSLLTSSSSSSSDDDDDDDDDDNNGTPRPQTSLYVHQAETVRPGDPAYIFRGDNDLPAYHLIRRVRDQQTGKEYSMQDLVSRYGFPDFLGLRLPDHDGFILESPHPVSHNLNAWLVINGDVETFVGHNLDLYDLSGTACMKDMETCMGKLLEQTAGETVLGALMFSCNGRGPVAGQLLTEDQADAKRFARVFPTVPLLGFYAAGEIGPRAVVGRQQSVFQQGHACLQGFTAVFSLFIVPKVDLASMRLDDSEESINAFLRGRFGAVGGSTATIPEA